MLEATLPEETGRSIFIDILEYSVESFWKKLFVWISFGAWAQETSRTANEAMIAWIWNLIISGFRMR
jgi:hypothetical protein